MNDQTFPDAYVVCDWKDSDKESYSTLVRVMDLDNKGKNIKMTWEIFGKF